MQASSLAITGQRAAPGRETSSELLGPARSWPGIVRRGKRLGQRALDPAPHDVERGLDAGGARVDPAERVAALAIGRLEQFDAAGIFGNTLAGHADLPEGAEQAEAKRDPGRAEGEAAHGRVFGSARHHERPRQRGLGMFILLEEAIRDDAWVLALRRRRSRQTHGLARNPAAVRASRSVYRATN